MKLDRANAVLVVIDVQERLMPVIDDADFILRNIERLVKLDMLKDPALLEQYVKGLGPTVAGVRQAFEETTGYRPLEKSCFSAHGCEPFAAQLAALERKQIIVTGVEAHVCVYQTCRDLLAAGFEVTIVADAVSSRTVRNRTIALERLLRDGAKLSSTEMLLFELLVTAGTDEFKYVSALVK